jgi:hypothetical protein
MEKKLPGRQTLFNGLSRAIGALGAALLLQLTVASTALAQDMGVAGTVTSTAGNPLRGVTVRVRGTEISTLTDANGRYRITAPRNGALSYSIIGQRAVTQEINGRDVIDVTMEPIAFLDEVVVTAYTEQRRADITGAVASMNVDAANRETGASVLKKLDATVPARDHGRHERFARIAEHGAHPWHQLVPEQRSALHRRRNPRSGIVHELPEPERHHVGAGAQGRVGRVHLRRARE